MIESILIAGGGTGGHVYPAVAVAEEVLARNPAARITFVGTAHGLESRILPRLGYTLETITVSRLKGGGILERIAGLMRVPVAMVQSWRVLRKAGPQVVLGVGGYASGPAVLTAWITRRPTAIQEQNATPGMTNKLLGRVVRRVFLGFEAAGRAFAASRSVFTGNPLRKAVVDALAGAAGREYAEAGRLRILVFGGSQGARFLNERAPEALIALADGHPELELSVVHQTGPADEEVTRERYASSALAERTTVTPFIHDMPGAYGASDLAICRAGALTVAELTAVGLPSLLVPFPFAADNHQEANARVMEEAGASWLVRQDDWKAEAVADWAATLAGDPTKLAAMSRAARGLARLEATRTIVDGLEEVAA